MKLAIIHAEDFMLDGGGTFGVVPKSIWQKTYPADENNLVKFAIKCLLVEYFHLYVGVFKILTIFAKFWQVKN